jgi:hypothetical protein
MRDSVLPFVVAACAAFFLVTPPMGMAQQEGDASSGDTEYAKILEAGGAEKQQIEEVDELLSGDDELEKSYLAYEDSLDANTELRDYEDDLFEAAEQDTVMARLLAAFEEEAAHDPEAANQLAYMDSLLAANPGLAERVRELEAAAAEDPELLDNYGDQMFYLCSRPGEGEEFFATDEKGPYYPGSDQEIVAFVYYLEKQPRLFRAYRSLYTYVRADIALKSSLYKHWRWHSHHRPLWKAHWRYRVWTARDTRVHRVVWGRRLYLGKRPWLGRSIWHHHFIVIKRPHARPVLWKHSAFVAKHPKYRGTVSKHRHWMKKHKPSLKAKPTKVKAAKVKANSKSRAKAKPKVKAKKKGR